MKVQVFLTTLASLKKHAKNSSVTGIVEIDLIAIKKKVGSGLFRNF